MDTFYPPDINLLIQYTFSDGLKLVPVAKSFLFASLIDDKHIAGYFTYFVRGDDVVINTFLPLVSVNTPEGKKFQEKLPK